MKRAWVLITLTLFSMPGTITASDGNRLLSSCENFLSEARDVGEDIIFRSDYDSGFCFGSMLMLQSLGNIQFQGDKSPALYICAPPGVRTSQYARIVVDYLQRNPQLLHESGASLAFTAVFQAFKCD